MANHRKERKDYVKEPIRQITLSIPISQYQLLEQFAEGTNRPMADVISEVFSDTALVSIRRMLAANTKLSTHEPASGLADLATAKLTPPPTPLLPDPPPPKAVPAEPSAWRHVENPAVNNLARPETQRSQQPTAPGLTSSRPPQAPITSSVVPRPVPPLSRGEPLAPTPLRPVMPPSAKPPSGDSEQPESAADSNPRSPHANE